MLRNFYFDLTDGVKIEKLEVNVYFENNLVMVILLKTRIEYPLAHSLLHIKGAIMQICKTTDIFVFTKK